MRKQRNVSAGLLMFRRSGHQLEVLLAHPGGPFWAKKDLGAWTIPKGEVNPDEDHLIAARREFEEETGIRPEGPFIPLDSIRQKAGKVIHAWACHGNFDPAMMKSNLVSVEWPPGSGRKVEFPEVDQCQWFSIEEARDKMNQAQVAFIERLKAALSE